MRAGCRTGPAAGAAAHSVLPNLLPPCHQAGACVDTYEVLVVPLGRSGRSLGFAPLKTPEFKLRVGRRLECKWMGVRWGGVGGMSGRWCCASTC